MSREAFQLARDTLRLAVKKYGWSRRNVGPYRTAYCYGPGKFEGEHWSVVHFYDAAMVGGDSLDFSQDTVQVDILEVSDAERAAFNLALDTQYVALWYSDSGFVTLEEMTADRRDNLIAQNEIANEVNEEGI